MPDPEKIDVKIEKKGLMSTLQWVGVVGVGSVLALIMVPRMMDMGDKSQTFIQERLINSMEKNAQMTGENNAALKLNADRDKETTEALEGVSKDLSELADQQEELVVVFKPLGPPLKGLVKVLGERVEQEAEKFEAEAAAEAEQ